MADSIEELDRRVGALRDQVRDALRAGDRQRVRSLRRVLAEAERAWHGAVAQDEENHERPGSEAAPGLLLPLREQVHQALTLLTVPAAPRLISAVSEALFAGAIPAGRVTSLRRDEERSFRTAPFARPYYLCAALSADFLTPVRGLLAVSTWPMERRVIGPLSPRVDYLMAAIQIAENFRRMQAPTLAARRLLWRFAANVPGGAGHIGQVDPEHVIHAARAELDVHADADAHTRKGAAARARVQLDDLQQLFGSGLRAVPHADADG
jgi:hypothetical protein